MANQMSLDTATTILGATSALAAIEALHYETVLAHGMVTQEYVKREVAGILDPVKDLLRTRTYPHKQFSESLAKLERTYELIGRHGGGQVALKSLDEADEIFRGRRHFGAGSIEEFIQAILVATHHKREADDTLLCEVDNDDPMTTCEILDNVTMMNGQVEALVKFTKRRLSTAKTDADKQQIYEALRLALKGVYELM